MSDFMTPQQMSDMITRIYKQRRSLLTDLIDKITPKLERAPQGKLRGAKHGKIWQYYRRESQTDKTGIYLPKGEKETIEDLAQKEYNTRLVRSAQKEIDTIDKLFDCFTKAQIQHPEDIYSMLPGWLQAASSSRWESTEEFVERWQREDYNRMHYGKEPDIDTKRGDKVRSKSERSIANALFDAHIPYHYEKPLTVCGNPKHSVIYPDFTALNIRLRRTYYWEHYGMSDDKDYADGMVRKFTEYYNNGIFPGERLIITFETKDVVLQEGIIDLMIRHYLQ